jgi:hypothetical protein
MWVKVEQGNFSNWFDVRINGELISNARSKAEGLKIAQAEVTKRKRRKHNGKVVR